jgi:aminopeptidase N
VHGNADAIGFYRVELDDALLDAVAAAAPALGAAERQSLLDDLWALVIAGRRPIDRFLDLLEALAGETDYAVVQAMVARAQLLLHRIADDASAPALRRFVEDLFRPSLLALGWDRAEGEHPERAVARAAVVGALGELAREAAVLREAEARARAERADPASVDPNLAATVVRIAALRADRRRVGWFVEEYLARRDRRASPEEQMRWLLALGAVEEGAAVREVLGLSLTETVPQEQLVSLLRALLVRPQSADETWRFLQRNWEAVANRTGPMAISRLVESLGALPARHRRSIERFFAAHPVPEAERALRQALEEVDLYEELRTREGPRLAAWLGRRPPPSR